MASSTRKVKLNNGVEVPIIGERWAIATPPSRGILSNDRLLITPCYPTTGTGSYPTPESRRDMNLMKGWVLSALKVVFTFLSIKKSS